LLKYNAGYAIYDPNDSNSIQNLLRASFKACKACNNAPVGAIHALCYALVASGYHIAHGIGNALCMLPVLKYNIDNCDEETTAIYAQLARVLDNEGALEDKSIEEQAKYGAR
jgi:alcohol dehydrogenase class IV